MVVNTEYYDLLGVDPGASEDDIRRGYLKQARRWHPDKCGGSEEAEARFKAISDAYKVLSDPQLRHVYDTSGKEGASQARGNADIDPVEQTIMLCKALFGSGKFDTVFGDPTTFPLFVMAIKMMERSQTTGRELDATAEIKAQLDRDAMKEADLKEKELVAELVVYLKKKLSFMLQGKDHQAAFADLCQSEAEFLSNSPGGDELVGVVGYVYRQEAKQHSTGMLGMEALMAEVAEKGHNLAAKIELLSMAVKLVGTSTRLQMEMERQEQEKLAPGQDQKAIRTEGGGDASGPPAAEGTDPRAAPSASPAEEARPAQEAPAQQQQQQQQKAPQDSNASGAGFGGVDDSDQFTESQQVLMEKMITEGLSAMWKLGKFLVEQRLRRVCEEVLSDKSMGVNEKKVFVDALRHMGEVYSRTSARMKEHHEQVDAKDQASEAFGLPKFR